MGCYLFSPSFCALYFQPLDTLGQGPENVFCKGPHSKKFRLCGPDSLCWSHSVLPCGPETATEIRKGTGMVTFQKNLQIEAAG